MTHIKTQNIRKHRLYPLCASSKVRPVPTVPTLPLAGALIGRRSELAKLGELKREVAGGRGRAVLIEGEPGIGKSALVRESVAEATDAGWQVFWGAGDELGTAFTLLAMLT